MSVDGIRRSKKISFSDSLDEAFEKKEKPSTSKEVETIVKDIENAEKPSKIGEFSKSEEVQPESVSIRQKEEKGTFSTSIDVQNDIRVPVENSKTRPANAGSEPLLRTKSSKRGTAKNLYLEAEVIEYIEDFILSKEEEGISISFSAAVNYMIKMHKRKN